MECTKRPGISSKKVSDSDFAKIKSILGLDAYTPLVVYSFDPKGNINVHTAESEFNSSPFALEKQRFLNIVPASFMVSQGSQHVTHTIAGESTTQSFPDDF